jgi:ferredoxin--NADP+ reductase
MKEEHWTRARVAERIDWAPGLFTLRFDVRLEPFRPGQFVAVGVDSPDPDEKRLHRLYSIASAPSEPAEFFVVEVEGGSVSPFLSALHEGDEGWVYREAKGVFTLDRVPDAEVLWLVSTGTGLAPFLSMLRTDEPWNRFERVVLAQGARTNAELAYSEELARHAAGHPGRLSVVRSVTREAPMAGIYAGRLTEALEDGELARRAGVPLDPATSQMMLCGNPEMIKQMSAMLHERGFRDHRKREPGHLTYERYW